MRRTAAPVIHTGFRSFFRPRHMLTGSIRLNCGPGGFTVPTVMFSALTYVFPTMLFRAMRERFAFCLRIAAIGPFTPRAPSIGPDPRRGNGRLPGLSFFRRGGMGGGEDRLAGRDRQGRNPQGTSEAPFHREDMLPEFVHQLVGDGKGRRDDQALPRFLV